MNFFDILEVNEPYITAYLDSAAAIVVDKRYILRNGEVNEEDDYELTLITLASRQVRDFKRTQASPVRGPFPYSNVELTKRNSELVDELERKLSKYSIVGKSQKEEVARALSHWPLAKEA